MSTWVVQVTVVALFALTCGVSPSPGCAGVSASQRSSCSAVALVVWIAAFLADHEVSSTARTTSRRVATSAARSTTCRRSRSSRRRSSSRSRLSRCSCPVAFVGARGGRSHTRITGSGELVQAPRPRRGPHRGRGRSLARGGGAGDRRGRPARRRSRPTRRPSRSRRPYAGTVLQVLVAEGDVVPVGTELVVIGAPGEAAPRTPTPRLCRTARIGPRAGDPGRPADRAGARRRPGGCLGERARRPDHRGRRAHRRHRGRAKAGASRCAVSAA